MAALVVAVLVAHGDSGGGVPLGGNGNGDNSDSDRVNGVVDDGEGSGGCCVL